MSLPVFPAEQGVPGDGSLIAVYGGSPAGVEVFGGLIHFAQVVQIHPHGGIGLMTRTGRRGEPLLDNGATIWIEGTLGVDLRGEPVSSDFAEVLQRWDVLRGRLLAPDLELFVYYHPDPPATFRKFKDVNAYLIHSGWDDPCGLRYLVAFVTLDRTLYSTAPGE
ncbi:MAG: hypothetical protein NZM31_03415 [Gemmatales bacterium]|nr:hypothetical protein [Gemmatales bacterium]MDW8386047.1 hypothetical protein [Gemmatales bacterium]